MVDAKIVDKICFLEMRNEDRYNCLSNELCNEITEWLQKAYDFECVGVVIKARCKNGVWSAGHDIKELPVDGDDPWLLMFPWKKCFTRFRIFRFLSLHTFRGPYGAEPATSASPAI